MKNSPMPEEPSDFIFEIGSTICHLLVPKSCMLLLFRSWFEEPFLLLLSKVSCTHLPDWYNDKKKMDKKKNCVDFFFMFCKISFFINIGTKFVVSPIYYCCCLCVFIKSQWHKIYRFVLLALLFLSALLGFYWWNRYFKGKDEIIYLIYINNK